MGVFKAEDILLGVGILIGWSVVLAAIAIVYW